MTETYGEWFVRRNYSLTSFVIARRVYEGTKVIRVQHMKTPKGRDVYFMKKENAHAAADAANRKDES